MLTATITESTETYYTDGPDGALIKHDVTYANVTDENGEEIETFTGPVSEDWLPGAWDAALEQAGYRRVGEWDLTNYTAVVEPK